MTDFTTLGLSEAILRAVAAEGYTQPTPIQAAAIPHVLEGQDLLGIAQTGTGKTAAFVLPMLDRLMGQPVKAKPRHCRAIILAPTRELATQIADCVRVYGKFRRPSVALILGGVAQSPQIRALLPGVDVVVGTPGRILDHMGTGALRLAETTIVVLDEADQMLDLGFVVPIRKIMSKVPSERQTLLFSATMPTSIRALADDFLRNPKLVSVTPASKPIERIDQRIMFMDAGAKRDALVTLLKGDEVERAIVFTRTKRGADKVSAHVQAAGISVAAIHGDKSQGQRDRALNAFRGNQVKVLIATDIAARGIDVDGISHVINFELPNVPESYVHRIGRTARAGAEGIAISLVDSTERPYLRDIEKLIGRSLTGRGEPGAGLGNDPTPSRKPQARRPAHNGPKPQGHNTSHGTNGSGNGHGANAHPGAAKPAAGPRGPASGKPAFAKPAGGERGIPRKASAPAKGR